MDFEREREKEIREEAREEEIERAARAVREKVADTDGLSPEVVDRTESQVRQDLAKVIHQSNQKHQVTYHQLVNTVNYTQNNSHESPRNKCRQKISENLFWKILTRVK